MVRDKNFRLILGYMILVLFIGLSGGTLNGRNASYSLQEDESFRYFRSFSLVSDDHLKLDANMRPDTLEFNTAHYIEVPSLSSSSGNLDTGPCP